MSEEERLVAMGRAVEEYALVRKRQAVLLAETSRLGGVLAEIANTLKICPHRPLSDLPHYPTAEHLASLCGEVVTVSARKEALERTLREFGVEVRLD